MSSRYNDQLDLQTPETPLTKSIKKHQSDHYLNTDVGWPGSGQGQLLVLHLLFLNELGAQVSKIFTNESSKYLFTFFISLLWFKFNDTIH